MFDVRVAMIINELQLDAGFKPCPLTIPFFKA
jgi:hypothetical protein